MSGGQAGLLAFAKEARIGAPFGKVVCEQGVAQGHAVALRADVEAVFVYSAAARFHIEEFAGRGVIYDHVAVFVYFAHEAAASALVAEFVPRCTVFQVAGYDGPRWKYAFSFWDVGGGSWQWGASYRPSFFLARFFRYAMRIRQYTR